MPPKGGVKQRLGIAETHDDAVAGGQPSSSSGGPSGVGAGGRRQRTTEDTAGAATGKAFPLKRGIKRPGQEGDCRYFPCTYISM